MPLSVVIPTFNQRTALADCLAAIEERTDDVEPIVVNGPSTDGTSGMIHDRVDVAVLVELATRNVNVARNVGIDRARGWQIAFLDPRHVVTDGWQVAIEDHLDTAADAASGPVVGEGEAGPSTAGSASDRTITPGNVAATRDVLMALDGFDEYLEVGGMLDFARRLRSREFRVVWHPSMAVERHGPRSDRAVGDHAVDHAWFEADTTDWGRVYRSLTYRAIKNGGLRPGPIGHVTKAAIVDGVRNGRAVLSGTTDASHWYRNGWSVLRNAVGGLYDGARARRTDRTPARNPYGLSNSAGRDVVVDEYDWR